MRVAYRYACYDNGVKIGVGLPEHWEKVLGVRQRAVCEYARHGYQYMRRYTFVKQAPKPSGKKEDIRQDWCREWDEVTARLRKSFSRGRGNGGRRRNGRSY